MVPVYQAGSQPIPQSHFLVNAPAPFNPGSVSDIVVYPQAFQALPAFSQPSTGSFHNRQVAPVPQANAGLLQPSLLSSDSLVHSQHSSDFFQPIYFRLGSPTVLQPSIGFYHIPQHSIDSPAVSSQSSDTLHHALYSVGFTLLHSLA